MYLLQDLPEVLAVSKISQHMVRIYMYEHRFRLIVSWHIYQDRFFAVQKEVVVMSAVRQVAMLHFAPRIGKEKLASVSVLAHSQLGYGREVAEWRKRNNWDSIETLLLQTKRRC